MASGEKAGLGDLAGAERPNLIGRERDDGERLPAQRGEFDFVPFVAVGEDDGAQIAGLETVRGEAFGESNVVVFADHKVDFLRRRF